MGHAIAFNLQPANLQPKLTLAYWPRNRVQPSTCQPSTKTNLQPSTKTNLQPSSKTNLQPANL
ncbi:MAG: restriction endonuclease [Moorea sp. SIO2I5]|nr:restriction endonuclease [Moorena sp. SIO2I5]